MKFRITFFSLLMIIGVLSAQQGKPAQKQPRRLATVGFMNVENLFDTIRSADYVDGTKDPRNPAYHRSIPVDSIPHLEVTEEYKGQWSDPLLKGKKVVRYQVVAEEFTPESNKRYGKKIYQQKLDNTAKVISEVGFRETGSAPVIMGLIEVENRNVVKDLISQPALKKYNYDLIHYNSFDARGVDVALIYQKSRFIPVNSYKKELKIYNPDGKREYTRDILVAIGYLDDEKVAVFMNHWPSRRGGEAVSLPKRNAAAALLKQQMDSIGAAHPSIKMFAMGDFNDDPVSSSLKKHLKAVGTPKELSDETPYLNLMYPLYKKGVASLAYQDAPNLFDQIIVSRNLVSDFLTTDYKVQKAELYAPPYLITKDGNFKGYPFRSWSGDRWTGGYSDHFPAFVVVQKAVKQN
ncbi:Endonuclease/Exonuclease/phosphatase family protein [Cruoricaptor ignavus]|uniref:Endonuclease/Exonuclease/phosphatase family protein n=2 Tax=Cruoricaptor ignavus TaxID=1118202 RepID=A0A1M6FGZ5_9FLAO|nr:Endonuclease/Exonuclease/phosphatase family protein [Cruoricaptor ignavus]